MTYFGNGGGSERFENHRSKQDFYRPKPHQHTNRNESWRQVNSSIISQYKKGRCSIDDVYKVTTSHLKANPQDVGRLMNNLNKANIIANVIVYNAAISVYGRGKQWKDALRLLQEMKQNKIQPNIITFNSTIMACAKGCQWELALNLLDEMEALEIPFNTIIFNSAITACANGRQLKYALDLLDEMKVRGIPRNTITYTSVIKACAEVGECERALDLIDEMAYLEIPCDIFTYNSAIKACAEAGQLEYARNLLKVMKQDEIQPDAITYGALISAYFNSNAKQKHEFINLLDKAVEEGIYQPNLGWNSEHTELDLHFEKVLTKQENDRLGHRPTPSGTAVSKAILLKALLEHKIKPNTKIITGKGEHFALRTCVINYLQQLHIPCKVDYPNEGCIIIKEVPNAK